MNKCRLSVFIKKNKQQKLVIMHLQLLIEIPK